MLNLIRTFSFSLILLFYFTDLFAQDQPIELRNPSFEELPYAGGNDNYFKAPKGWYNCGKPGETPPDVQPNLDPFREPFFQVTKKAQHDNTYLGMVVRDNDTWEAVGQRLRQPLQPGKCYEFSLHLARSPRYVSPSRDQQIGDINHNQPVVVRIYGGNGYCQKKQLLDETGTVGHTTWQKYNFRFEPNSRMDFILVEAFYKTPTLLPYNGNVLVDNLSNINPIPCDNELPPETEPVEENLIASNDEIVPDKKVNVKPSKDKPKPPKPEKTPPSYNNTKPKRITPKPPKDTPKKTNKILKQGQTIKIDRLYFAVDDSLISEESYEALDEIYETLSQYKNVVVEIQGHTNDRCDEWFCNQLSTARARAVADYLHQKGIAWQKLKFKGFGKKKPVASNNYKSGRKKNQRVEVKILSLDG